MNLLHLGKILGIFALVGGMIGLVGCSAGDVELEDQAENIPLILYISPTPTPLITATVPAMEPTVPPLPTPTPFIYSVVAEDTLLGIAVRYNITLNELLAANPGVDPRFLSIGSELVIPTGEGESIPSALPSPTPAVSVDGNPDCYLTSSRGLWCFWLVENDQGLALENLTAVINLFNSSGELVGNQTALSPLNIVKTGEAIPLMVYFQPPVPNWAVVQAQLLTALSVSAESDRYLDTKTENLKVVISPSGLAGRISGTIQLEVDKPASLIWVAAVAYDEQGRVVGVRRWENEEALEARGSIVFDLEVFSLGPTIARVETLVEARP